MQNEQTTSSPPSTVLASWRVFLECSWALTDILDAELRAATGITLRWYDVLVHLEDAAAGLPMHEIASRILASKSGLTRVIDRMEADGLVRRERPADDRRVVLVSITDRGRDLLTASRAVHRDGIRRHFGDHVGDGQHQALAAALQPVREHVRPLRPGRISG